MHPRLSTALLALLLAWAIISPAQADTLDESLMKVEKAWQAGDRKAALTLANQVIADNPKEPRAHLTRGVIHEALGKHAEAVADFSRCLELDPTNAQAWNHRGSEQFKLGKVVESVADFDRFLKLKPDETAGHWKRGISLYYVGRFEDGKKQFEGYEKVDTNDVENAVWHFLCNARLVGLDKARGEVLKIGNDRRVPMMQVYDLYRGKLKPEEVLAAAEAGNTPEEQKKQRLFYAHLYLGIYQDVAGDKKKALEHLTLAAGKYRIGHYMGDVAQVHRDLLARQPGEK
jgi:lipoprotein NlpI